MIGVDAWRRPAGVRVTVASAWVVWLAALLLWLLRTPPSSLQEELKTLQVWSLGICVLLGLGLSAVVLRDLARLIDRRDLLGMAIPIALAVGLTIAVVPRTNRIYYDEHLYQNAGQNIADMNLAQICNDGTIENGRLRCSIGLYNKEPYAYPHVLSLAYRIFGAGTTPAFVVNAIAVGLTVGCVYLLVVLLFSDRIAAFFAALLLALTPEQLLWSATAAVEPSASLAYMAALLSAACFVRMRTMAFLLGTAVATAYAVQFRPEGVLIIPVVGVLIWQRAREEVRGARLWWAGLLLLGLVSVHLGHMVAVRNEGWGTTHAPMALAYVRDNLRVNGWFYLADSRFPAAYTLLALLGLWGRRTEAGRMTMALYFLVFFGIALGFYAGSYNYGADVRYSVATYPPLVILGGLGIAGVIKRIDRVMRRVPATLGLTATLAVQFLWYLPVVRANSDGAWAARADVQFARSLVPALPANAYVLTHNPGMFQLWGVSAGQMFLAVTKPGFLEDLDARYAGGVYLHWSFWCNVQDPNQRKLCTKVLELTPGKVVREYQVQDQHYRLYRLSPVGRR